MAVTAIAAIAAAGVGVYKLIKSARDKKKAREAAAALYAPKFKMQDEYKQNSNIATTLAGQGFTSGAKEYITNENRQGLASSISSLERMGGGSNDMSSVYGAYLRSVNQVGAQDSQMQIQNIQNLMNQNKEIAGQKNMMWSLNEDRTYQNKIKELKMEQQIADQNMWDGVNTTVGSLGALGTSLSNSGYNKQMISAGGGNGGGGANRYADSLASQPVQTMSSFGGGNQVIQNRTSPNVNMSNNNFGNSAAGGGGYYPGSADYDWSSVFGNDYQ